MNLMYKTRGMTPPRGKPWVYLCAHPSELSAVAERLADELLAKQDCAVWYPEDPSAERDAAFFAALGEMQLIVMPVTKRLLTERSDAVAAEFAFATERHTPVLPLMQEGGLDDLFGHVFGALQYLDPQKTDDTAIGYEEKLAKYLDSILIGDELAAKIRAAFDAYVFLSYRKKDRAHAQELMRLIHKNDFCRDIAIWYDEFLTPGENWSQAIGDALEKSDLFVMAVTPNLVCETNYVMTKEYPLARDMGKAILPAELIPTDRALLEEKYEGLPDCTDAHDAPSLAKALTAAFAKLAVRENDTPEHKFFIGLAYLGGVDVEVDHEAAVRLITEAAEGGVPAAAEKLVTMYRTGHGVARSYGTALAWQERAVALWEALVGKDDTVDRIDGLFWALLTLGDYYRESGDRDRAEVAYRRALTRLNDTPLFSQTPFFERHYALAYNRLGNVLADAGDWDGAREAYEQYAAYSERRAFRKEQREDRRNCAVASNKLGDLYRDRGDFATARTYYERALAISEALAEESATAQARRDLTVSYERVGEICRAAGDDEGALAYFRKDHANTAALAEELGTPEAQRDLGISSYRLGQLLAELGHAKEAEGYLLQDLSLSRALDEQLGTVSARRDLGLSHYAVGEFYGDCGRADEALPHLDAALSIQRRLVADGHLPDDRMHLCESLLAFGNVYYRARQASEAYAAFAEALPIARELAATWPMSQAKRQLCRLYSRVIQLTEQTGQGGEAVPLMEEALPALRDYAQETGAAWVWYDVSYYSGALGDAYVAAGETERAKPLYAEHLDICRTFAEQFGRPEERDELAIAYYRMATVDEEQKAACLREAIALYEGLVAEFPQEAKYRSNLEELKTM